MFSKSSFGPSKLFRVFDYDIAEFVSSLSNVAATKLKDTRISVYVEGNLENCLLAYPFLEGSNDNSGKIPELLLPCLEDIATEIKSGWSLSSNDNHPDIYYPSILKIDKEFFVFDKPNVSYDMVYMIRLISGIFFGIDSHDICNCYRDDIPKNNPSIVLRVDPQYITDIDNFFGFGLAEIVNFSFKEVKKTEDCYRFKDKIVALKAESKYYSGGCDKEQIRFAYVFGSNTDIQYSLFLMRDEITGSHILNTSIIQMYGKIYMRYATKEECSILSEHVHNDIMKLEYTFDKEKVLDLLS